jgi:hypothetical protein
MRSFSSRFIRRIVARFSLDRQIMHLVGVGLQIEKLDVIVPDIIGG